MLTPSQIKQLAELVNEAGIDVKNISEAHEFIGLLLENISGFESINNVELAKIQVDVLSALKNR
ncbi:MAG: 2-hydroxy-3-keto-5-methylthiopentenyl-1-phosphate phosphatase [Colwellia sp.]|jgi:2-hydroxy-3-keto-5-methylthiopentenyl-1-phosphate phosphatase